MKLVRLKDTLFVAQDRDDSFYVNIPAPLPPLPRHLSLVPSTGPAYEPARCGVSCKKYVG
jgi:hypothetical protein